MKIILPIDGPKPSYYKAYVGYLLNVLVANDIHPTFEGHATHNVFEIKIDSKSAIVDFSDFQKIDKCYDLPYFKFHWCKSEHGELKNVSSFTPISFYDWQEFYALRNHIEYKCNSDLIVSMQRPRGAAVKRRIFVQSLLKRKYGKNLRSEFVNDQHEFWKTINDCLVHVCVPGARDDILDRGQLQAMAFGCCTISPIITDYLAWSQELVPNVNYVSCNYDYSDLVEKIEWCKSNRDKCIEIGRNAQKLFQETSVPSKLLEWIIKVVNDG